MSVARETGSGGATGGPQGVARETGAGPGLAATIALLPIRFYRRFVSPALGRRWEYVFFTDVEGHRTDAAVSRAIERLRANCSTVKVLGSYPRSDTAERGAPSSRTAGT